MQDLTLVIPAKNESESLPIFLDEISNLKYKKLIVLEHSDKSTLDSIKNYSDIEILYLETAGNPHAPLTLSNDDLVLVCIARVSKEGLNPKVNNEDVWKKVINSYNIHSRKAIYLQMKKSITEIMKLFYYIFGHFILENITIHLHKTIQKIKALTSYRIH